MISRQGIATAFRLAGPLVEVACIATLFSVRGRGVRVLGFPAESLLYAGIGLGFGLVVLGVVLSRRAARPVDKWDRPRDAS